MSRTIIAVLVALLVVAGIWYLNRDVTGTNDTVVTPTTNEPNENATTTDTQVEGEVKEFTVTGSPFQFDVKEIRVNEGDTVLITFKNAEGMHDWVVDELNARTEVIPAGEEQTIEFVANQAGTFEYYCSVGNHRAMGMVGTLIVE